MDVIDIILLFHLLIATLNDYSNRCFINKWKLPLLLQDLATPGAFRKDPSLVWEFYHYRREVMVTKEPNKVQ